MEKSGEACLLAKLSQFTDEALKKGHDVSNSNGEMRMVKMNGGDFGYFKYNVLIGQKLHDFYCNNCCRSMTRKFGLLRSIGTY